VCDIARVGTFRRGLARADFGYPAAWIAVGTALFAFSITGRAPWSYRAGADRICAGAHRVLTNWGDVPPITDQFVVRDQMTAFLARLTPPRNWENRHRELLRRMRLENDALRTALATGDPNVQTQAYGTFSAQLVTDHAALRRLGYRACADA
jgi:hypothetical protein